MATDGTLHVLPKLTVSLLLLQQDKLQLFLGGITHMPRIPHVLLLVHPRKTKIAVQTAQKLLLPIVAMVHTNTDPHTLHDIIPSNEHAIRAVRYITSKMADAIITGNQGTHQTQHQTQQPAADKLAHSHTHIDTAVTGDNKRAN